MRATLARLRDAVRLAQSRRGPRVVRSCLGELMRVPVRSFATLVLAVSVATCADAPTVGRARTGATNGARGRGTIAMAPVFSQTAAAVYAQRATFAAASFDHVRIVLVRPGPPADTLRDTTIVF